MMEGEDWIFVERFRLPLRIGCERSERAHPQNVALDLRFAVDTRAAARSGKLSDTVCYLQVTEVLAELAHRSEWPLLEQFAEEALALLFARFPAAAQIEMRISKFVVAHTDGVGLRVLRSRKL